LDASLERTRSGGAEVLGDAELLDGAGDGRGTELLADGFVVVLRDEDADESSGGELLHDELDSAWRFESPDELRSQSDFPLVAAFGGSLQ
jgi:hypothetical protein